MTKSKTKRMTAEDLGARRMIVYYRVSAQRQGRSGLGLEAQRSAVTRFAESGGLAIVAEFIEVETGSGADALAQRPQLAAALAQAKKLKCPVIVAKLDRLSRDVAFIAGLMAQKCLSSSPSLASIAIHSCCISMPRWRRKSAA
jgi:resolvase-like protein